MTGSLLLVLFAAGCGGDRMVAVHGKVTFQGQPVTEGVVQFSDDKTGHGAEVPLQPDGTYQVTLPAGRYAVVVLPPLVGDGSKDPNSPGGEVYKKVRNIPPKYRSTATSQLAAEVSAAKPVHDFDLTAP